MYIYMCVGVCVFLSVCVVLNGIQNFLISAQKRSTEWNKC